MVSNIEKENLGDSTRSQKENRPRETKSRQLILDSLISLLPSWKQQTPKPISNAKVSQDESWRSVLMRSRPFARINEMSINNCIDSLLHYMSMYLLVTIIDTQ